MFFIEVKMYLIQFVPNNFLIYFPHAFFCEDNQNLKLVKKLDL